MPEKRVIDTRGGGNVNLGKYDERFDRLAGAHAGENVKRGKEKFQNKQKQRQQQAAASAKRSARRARDRIQKLQFEIAKKAQLKVQIPDAIGVGELASRMKKTGAEVVQGAHKERRNGLAVGHHRLRHRRPCGDGARLQGRARGRRHRRGAPHRRQRG
ncbi:MAG: hypothetical protein ACLTSG_13495 [Lachnospiraceae bacterium]